MGIKLNTYVVFLHCSHCHKAGCEVVKYEDVTDEMLTRECKWCLRPFYEGERLKNVKKLIKEGLEKE